MAWNENYVIGVLNADLASTAEQRSCARRLGGTAPPALARRDDSLKLVLVPRRCGSGNSFDVYARRSRGVLLQRTAFAEEELGGVLRDTLMVHFKVQV